MVTLFFSFFLFLFNLRVIKLKAAEEWLYNRLTMEAGVTFYSVSNNT